jgi:hypothetical protein
MEYIVSIKEDDPLGGTVIVQRTVVYTESELQAKVQGAEMLGVGQERVTVTPMGPSAVNPNLFRNAKAPDLPSE